MIESSQANRIRVALPDDVNGSHAEIDWPAFKHGGSDVEQYAIPHFDCVVQAQNSGRRSPGLGGVLECTFPSENGLRVLADRRTGVRSVAPPDTIGTSG